MLGEDMEIAEMLWFRQKASDRWRAPLHQRSSPGLRLLDHHWHTHRRWRQRRLRSLKHPHRGRWQLRSRWQYAYYPNRPEVQSEAGWRNDPFRARYAGWRTRACS